MKKNKIIFMKYLKELFRSENFNISFNSLEKNKSQRMKNDTTFVILFLLIPYAFSFLDTIFPSANRLLMFVLITIIKLGLYLVGYYLISPRKRMWLKNNGGNAFFWGLFFLQGLWALLTIIIDYSTNDAETIQLIGIIFTDIFRILVVIIVLFSSPGLRKDIKKVVFYRLPFILVIVMLFFALTMAGSPLFNLINNIITGGTTSTNQSAIDTIFSNNDFRTYWLLMTVAFMAPIYEEIVYRHSLMLIIDTKWLRFLVPFLHFVFVHVSKNYSQDFIHSFLYVWISFLFTGIMFIKRNVAYSISCHSFINQMTFFL